MASFSSRQPVRGPIGCENRSIVMLGPFPLLESQRLELHISPTQYFHPLCSAHHASCTPKLAYQHRSPPSPLPARTRHNRALLVNVAYRETLASHLRSLATHRSTQPCLHFNRPKASAPAPASHPARWSPFDGEKIEGIAKGIRKQKR